MNLVAHRLKNRRTVIIYALSLSFINFIYVSLVMQLQLTQQRRLRVSGSELTLSTIDDDKASLTIEQLVSGFTALNLLDKIDYGFKFESLTNSFSENRMGNYTIQNKGRIVSRYYGIHPVSANYESVVESRMNTISQ